jgi:hypothetical protein
MEVVEVKKRYKNYGSGISYKGVYLHYFKSLERGAKRRKLTFNIVLEDIGDLWEKQEHKCVYSGEILIQKKSKKAKKGDYTASLDRIDSKKGYELGNLQWVDKEINKFKRDYSENTLERLCEIVLNGIKNIHGKNKS